MSTTVGSVGDDPFTDVTPETHVYPCVPTTGSVVSTRVRVDGRVSCPDFSGERGGCRGDGPPLSEPSVEGTLSPVRDRPFFSTSSQVPCVTPSVTLLTQSFRPHTLSLYCNL